jgi:hypothetical protein
MKKPAWEKCKYYREGHCPQHGVIDKVYLIPQLLDASQVQAAQEICEDCAKYLADGRKYPPLKRPFEVVIIN